MKNTRWKDVDTLKKVLLAGWCVPSMLACLAATGMAAESATNAVTTRGDGSRTPGVHRIPLYAESLEAGKQGDKITKETDPALPFSIRGTCSECHIYKHDYDVIKKGWHFNAADPNVPAGRPGQPWIYADASTGTQIPLSYRAWPGTFRPEQVGMTPFQFTHRFGRQMPGGGVGEMDTKNDSEIPRQMVSGKLEINCLSCHDRDPAHDQAEVTGQVAKQNFRWAATASASFALVSGSAKEMDDTFDYLMPDMVSDEKKKPLVPTVTYQASAFDAKDQVVFNVSGKIPAERCYFCHSDINVDQCGNEKWHGDEDVHLTAGLTCVDCHREGLEHDTIRGYEGEVSTNAMAARTSCRGCHLGDENHRTEAGRLGAPVPEHKGIPTVHFERLSCTACHSGPWPGDTTFRVKTSQAHGLGSRTVNKHPNALPHVQYPVFAKATGATVAHLGGTMTQDAGKITPHKLIWPAYWGAITDDGKVRPLDLTVVKDMVGPALKGLPLTAAGDWAEIKETQVIDVLKALGGSVKEGKPVYVTGGTLYRLNEGGTLASYRDHPAAAPYAWPIAHNVRPAAQSLGVGKCTVCHATNSAFFFGKVPVDSPILAASNLVKTQYEFQQAPHGRTWAFAMSFVFRPWFKVVAIGSAGLIGIVLLLYGLRALGAVARVLAEQQE
ncbi:MAG: hypothetical protein MUC88_10650 [Planctomycetes bacterium]|nr:hypothetical protein [Planctomycetota bacterium]